MYRPITDENNNVVKTEETMAFVPEVLNHPYAFKIEKLTMPHTIVPEKNDKYLIAVLFLLIGFDHPK